MPRKNTGLFGHLWSYSRPAAVALGMLFVVFQLVSCSPGEPVQPNADGVEGDTPTDPAPDGADEPIPQGGAEPSDGQESDVESDAALEATAQPERVLVPGEESVVEIVDLVAGQQYTDAQGNLVVIYGIASWPETFTDLPAASRPGFAFSSPFDVLGDSQLDLVALDIGMCAAGIGLSDTAPAGFGTVEFFVHDSPTAPLSNDPIVDRSMVIAHPVAGSGFEFPAQSSCARGWLPVVRASDRSPTVARYVLTNRTSSTAPIERHVYQWEVDAVGRDLTDSTAASEVVFAAGQTVTFNEGPLAETTVVVDGWAELVGQQAALGGTRLVAVSLSFCPSGDRLPEFGLAVDGWNLIAPERGSDLLGAQTAGEPTQSCFDGWLRFAVPFGAVPTGFFASDGLNADTGYAFWTLDGAALPAPEE